MAVVNAGTIKATSVPISVRRRITFDFAPSANIWEIALHDGGSATVLYAERMASFDKVVKEAWGIDITSPDWVLTIGSNSYHAEAVEIGVAVASPSPAICPDCKGTGEYRGLITIEPCRTCRPGAAAVPSGIIG